MRVTCTADIEKKIEEPTIKQSLVEDIIRQSDEKFSSAIEHAMNCYLNKFETFDEDGFHDMTGRHVYGNAIDALNAVKVYYNTLEAKIEFLETALKELASGSAQEGSDFICSLVARVE